MKRVYLVVLLLLVISSPVVLSQRRKSTTKTKTATPQAKPSKPQLVKDEATDEANKVWEKYVTWCDGSYYMRPCCDGEGGICEYRYVSISKEDLPLNEPDRLNGIERKIVSYFAAKAERCQRGAGWEDWHSVNRMSVNLTKQSGIWSADKPKYSSHWPMNNTKISCSDIPDDHRRRSLNLDNYCRSKHGDSAVAVNTARDAYAWRCKVDDVGGNKRYFEVNMDEACQGQYGSEFKAAVDNLKDFASWHCIPK